MDRINLQDKTHALFGKVIKYWFENVNIGLAKTLFHRISIPLAQFNSGLEYETQPVSTEIIIEWLYLGNTEDLDNLQISSREYKDMDASIYVGGAHNVCEVLSLRFTKKEEDKYEVVGNLVIDFESEGVAENEGFSFETVVVDYGMSNDIEVS